MCPGSDRRQDDGEGDRRERGRGEARARAMRQRRRDRHQREEHRERRGWRSRVSDEEAGHQGDRDNELGEARETAAAADGAALVEDDHARTAAAPSAKIGACSAANEPLIPTPSRTMAIVSHHTTRSVASALALGATPSSPRRSIGEVCARGRRGQLSAASGQHDPHQQKAGKQRRHGDDDQLGWHEMSVPRVAESDETTATRRPGQYGGGGRDGANVLTQPYYPTRGQDAPQSANRALLATLPAPMSDGVCPGPVSALPRRPWLAALLSFVVPGLGQAYAGRWQLAAVLAIPVLALAVIVVGVASGALNQIRTTLLTPNVLAGVLLINGIVLLWRGIAITEAGLTPWSGLSDHQRRVGLLSVAGLLVVTLAMHLWVAGVVVQLDRTLAQVFPADPVAGAAPADPSDQPSPEAEPSPSSEPAPVWDGTERINILLLGTDAAPGRDVALTDVVLVISADPATRSAVMISVPRDTGFVPLPSTNVFEAGLYPDRVNSLLARASSRAAAWCPDLDPVGQATECGLRAVDSAVGLYLGIRIHHHAVVDMAGFADMIDAIGGVELCLPGRLVDPEFDSAIADRHADGLILPAGCHHYDGLDALAYARSRKGWIEMPDGSIDGQSDFDRAERQQALLLAMRAELQQSDTFLELPELLQAIGRTIITDVERAQAGDLAGLLPIITGPDIERVVLGYPEYVDAPADATLNYLLIPKRDAIRERMAEIFGADELSGWYLATDAPAP